MLAGKQIRFFFQAESDGNEADILWINEGNRASHVKIELDGKPAPVSSTGLTDALVYHFPFQAEINLAYGLRLSPGRHRLKVSVTGDKGIYANLRQERFRRFAGTLVSNELAFEVAK